MEVATLALPIIIGLVGVALLFDFLNGLHVLGSHRTVHRAHTAGAAFHCSGLFTFQI